MPAPPPVEVFHGPLVTPAGRPLHRAVIPITAVAPANPLLDGGGAVLSKVTPDTNTDGWWRAALLPSSSFARRDAYYVADERKYGGELWAFRVPDSGGPYSLESLLIEPPPLGVDPEDSGTFTRWWHGDGPPPEYIEGASPGDIYVDDLTGDIYQDR